ncbi:hypothetical protein FRX31_032991, partial [Thalictrum thalictroides]
KCSRICWRYFVRLVLSFVVSFKASRVDLDISDSRRKACRKAMNNPHTTSRRRAARTTEILEPLNSLP